MFSVDRLVAYVLKIMVKQCAMNQSLGNSTKSRTHTLVWRRFATATTAEQISVDGDGNQWREVAGGEETIWSPEEAEHDTLAG